MPGRVDPQNQSNRQSSKPDWISNLSVPYLNSNNLVLFSSFCLIIFLGFIAYDFYSYSISSPRHEISLQVEGLENISEARVREVLRPIIGEADERTTLLNVSVYEIQERLMDKISRFTKVNVSKSYPQKLKISVKERNAVGLVARYDSEKEDNIYLPVDREGILFQPTESEVEKLPQEVPIIRGLENYDPQSDSFQRRWNRVRRVMNSIDRVFSDDLLNWVEIIPGGYARIQIDRPKKLEVQLGMDNYDTKTEKLNQMMQTTEFIQINDYIDLSDLNNIRVK